MMYGLSMKDFKGKKLFESITKIKRFILVKCSDSYAL